MSEEEFDPSTEDSDLRVHLSRLPRHEAPPALMAMLRRKYMGPTWLETFKQWFVWPSVWKPAGILGTAALMGILWFSFQKRESNETIALGPLLAAHTATQAQGLVPDSDMTAADLSTQLASYANN